MIMRSILRYTLPIFILLFAGMLAVHLLFGRAGVPDAFADSPSFEEALQQSAESNKPVLVLATADWCLPCQHLKRNALRDQRVADAIRERTIPVYLDVTRDEGGSHDIADALDIGPIPAMILIKDGAELKRIEGDRSALELLSWLGDF